MGGWWRVDEVVEPSLQPLCSRAQEVVPVAPTQIEVEDYDSDHEASDQVTTEPRRTTRTLRESWIRGCLDGQTKAFGRTLGL